VAQIDTHDQLEKILDGWQQAMVGDGGAEWLADRLRAAGVATAPVDPSADAVEDIDPPSA